MARTATSSDPFGRPAALLGFRRRIRSSIELHERIKEGLPRSTAVTLVSGLQGISAEEAMAALNISSRTWHRIKAETEALSKPLDVDQSSRVWSMAEIIAMAEEGLGSREEAEQWLRRPAIGLDSRRPIDLMATPQGAELVKTLLARMEHGVYA